MMPMFIGGLSGVLLFFLSFFPQDQAASVQAGVSSAGFEVRGVVVDAVSEQPLAHAQVFLAGQELPEGGLSTNTSDDGRFAFNGLASGHYMLSARRRGYVQQAYNQHESFSTAIITGPGQDTSHVRFRLPPEASISGQVVDEMNDPVRHAQVILYRRGLRPGRRATWRNGGVSTDDQGSYRFGHLLPGTYFVAVSAQPWYAQHVPEVIQSSSGHGETFNEEEIIPPDPAFDVVYPITFFSNARDIAGAVPIVLHTGDAARADLTLRPIPALHVTVSYEPSAEPNGPQNVWAEVTETLPDGLNAQISARPMPIHNGLMEVAGLPPGSINLTFHSSDGPDAKVRSLSLQLAANSEVNLSEAAPNANLSGIVKTADGTPLTNTVVQFRNRNGGEQFGARVEPNGQFTLPGRSSLRAGTYDVFLAGPSNMTVGSLSATGAKISGRTVEIAAGQDVKLTVIASKGTGHITGVALKDEKPLDGVMVVLVPEVPENNLDLFRRDQSDSDGTFNLAGIVPGKYTVIALENGWGLDWSAPSALQKYLPNGERVEVVPNAKLQVKVKVLAVSQP